MGEWMDAYIEIKDAEPSSLGGDSTVKEWQCKGVLDREGKCPNVIQSVIFRMYCDDCHRYFKEKTGG